MSSFAPSAYRSPWRVRREEPHPIVCNASPEPLVLARAMIRVGDRVDTEQWGTVLPGDENEICLCGIDTSDACVTVSWRRSGDTAELLWQFVI